MQKASFCDYFIIFAGLIQGDIFLPRDSQVADAILRNDILKRLSCKSNFHEQIISIIEIIINTYIIQDALVFNAAIYQPESFFDNFRYYLDISNFSKTFTCILINESFMEIFFITIVNENNFRDNKMFLESTQFFWKAQNSYCDGYYKHFVAVSSIIAKFWANFLFIKNIYVKNAKIFWKICKLFAMTTQISRDRHMPP